MCERTIDVVDLGDQRSAYEVEEFLVGVPAVENVQADFINDTIVVEYNENVIDYGVVLDRIEHAGCTPAPRATSVIDRFKLTIGRL